VAVAAAAIGGDHQTAGLGIALLSHGQPPAVNRVDGETGGIVIGADTDPALVVGDVIDTVRDGTPQFGINKVVHIDRFGGRFGTPFSAVIF
jgi:hypothetical protein